MLISSGRLMRIDTETKDDKTITKVIRSFWKKGCLIRTPFELICGYWGAMWILESNIDATKPFPYLGVKWIQLEVIDGLKLSNLLSTHYEKNQKKEFLSLCVSS